MFRQLGIVVAVVALCAAALSLPAAAREGSMAPVVSSATSQDLSAQKVKRARKPVVRRMAAAGPVAAPVPHHQQCFLFFCSNGRPFHWLVLGVAY